MEISWDTLKEKVYYFDGAWLDIYVQQVTREDWFKWTEYVNSTYELSFTNGQTGNYEKKIDFSVVVDFWDGKTDLCNDARIKLNTIDIKCHFFDETEIENDIDPDDVKNIDDHNKLISYLIDISKLLCKPVILTPENTPELPLIIVTLDEVKIKLY